MKSQKHEFPKCPLCGSEMSVSMMDNSFFCYGLSQAGRCPALPELESAFNRNATQEVKWKGFPNNPFQWQTVAVIADLNLTTTRSGSQSNIKLERLDRSSLSGGDAVKIIELNKIVWMDWTER